jgi:uncharacterized membrane protein YfcA
MILRNRGNIDFQLIIYPLIGSLIFIPVGVYLLNLLSGETLEIFLGAALITISVYFLLGKNRRLNFRPGMRNGILAGAIAGSLNGVLSVGGPPLVLWFDLSSYPLISLREHHPRNMSSIIHIGSRRDCWNDHWFSLPGQAGSSHF